MRRKANKYLMVAIACVLEGTQVLMVRRREREQADLNEMWELPGGKIEPSENPSDTAIRETIEETGYRIEIVASSLSPYTTHWDYGDYYLHTTVLCLEARLETGQQAMSADTKVARIQWFDLNNVPLLETLPGSRDFIIDVATRHNIELRHDIGASTRILFERVDPTENANKFYWIEYALEPGEKEAHFVTRTWGHYGWPPRTKANPFQDYFACRDHILRIAEERISHKYRIVEGFDFGPLRNWLGSHKQFFGERITLALPLFGADSDMLDAPNM